MAGDTVQTSIVGGQHFDKARNTPQARAQDFAEALAPALAAALSPLLSSRVAAEQEVKNAADSLRLLVDRQTRTQAITSESARVMAGVRSALDTGYGDRSATSDWLPDGRRQVPSAPSALPPVPFPEGRDHDQQMSNYDYYSHGRHYSVGQLRADTGRSIGRSISGLRFGPPLQESSTGQMMRIDPHTGEVVGQATRNEVGAFHAANKVRGVAGDIAENGMAKGIINALPKGFGPALGIAGAAWAVGNQVADWSEKQRQENAYYQQISGGSNLSGFVDRARQTGFRWSQRGVMGGSAADELYRGVYATVGEQDSRQRALELGVNNFARYGMQIADTLKIIETAAKTGNEDLVGVADALDQVTASAKDAHRNAQVARDVFAQTYSQTAGVLTGSGTAAGVSGALTSVTASLGEQFSNVDFSGMFSQDMMRRQAAREHKTYGQYIYANQGAAGEANILNGSQSMINEMINAQLGPKGKAIIAQYRKDHGITGKLTSEQANDIAGKIMEAGVPLDPQAIMTLFGSFNIKISDPNDALPMLVMWGDEQSLGGSLTAEAQKITDSFANKKVGSGGMSNTDVAKALGYNLLSTQAGVAGPGGDFLTTTNGTQTTSIDINDKSNIAAMYYKAATTTGTYSPIVADLIKKDPDAKITVNGKETTIREAIASGNVDALNSGTATYADGDNKGKSLNDVALGKSSGKDAQTKNSSGGTENTLRVYFDAGGMKATINGNQLTSGGSSTIVLDPTS